MRTLLIILLFIPFAVKAQYVPNAGAYQYKGLKQTNSLQPPSTAGMPVTAINAPDSNYAALYYNKTDTTWYGFNPVTKTWSRLNISGGSNIRDTAKLFAQYGIIIHNADSTYAPNGLDVAIGIDTTALSSWIIDIVNGDTTVINNSDSIPALIVDTISKSPPAGVGENYKVIVGSASGGVVVCTGLTGVFVGHCGEIAEHIGSVWVFTTPTCNQQVIVDNSLAYSTWQYKCPSNVWKQTSILWRVNGNSGIGANAFLGRKDKQALWLRSWNLNVMKLDTNRDVSLLKYTGLQNLPLYYKPGLNGKIDTARFSTPIYSSPAKQDSIMYVDAGVIKYGMVTASGGGSGGRNIYNSDSTLAGNRTVTGANRSITWDGVSKFSVNANDSFPVAINSVKVGTWKSNGLNIYQIAAGSAGTDSLLTISGGQVKKISGSYYLSTSPIAGGKSDVDSNLVYSSGIAKKAAPLGYINILDYGGLGDSSTDNSTAISNAMAALPASGGTIYFPSTSSKGMYKFNSAISVTKPIKFLGDGFYSTILFTNSGTINLFEVSSGGVRWDGLLLSNLSTSVPTAGAAIRVTGSNSWIFDKCYISNFYYGIQNVTGCCWTISNSIISPINTGVYVRDSTNPDSGDQSIFNTIFIPGRSAPVYMIYQKSGGGLKIQHCKINMSGVLKPQYGYYGYFDEGFTADLLINNCSFENFSKTAVYVENTSGNHFGGNITITGNQMASYRSDSITTDVKIGNGVNGMSGCSVIGNTFYAANTSSTAVDVNFVLKPAVSNSYYNYTTPTVFANTANTVIDNSTLSPFKVVLGQSSTTGQLTQVTSAGTSAQVLTSNGASANPTFQDLPALNTGLNRTWTGLNTYSTTANTSIAPLLELTYGTAATVSQNQYSPSFHWKASGWKTNSTAAAQDVEAWATLKSVTGTANPSGNLTFETDVNNSGGKTTILTLNTNGWVGIRKNPTTALDMSYTMPTTISADTYGASFDITSAGSSSFNNGGLLINYNAGYTGSSRTAGLFVNNTAVGTGTTLVANNTGGFYTMDNTTTGFNTGSATYMINRGSGAVAGLTGTAWGGLGTGQKYGVLGSVIANSATNAVGMYAFVTNATTFAQPPTANGVIVAENAGTSIPLLKANVSGSTKVQIDENGNTSVTGFRVGYVAKTSTYTATASDYIINCTGTFTVTLPTAASVAGKEYKIVNSGSGTITIATTSSQTFTNITSTPTTLTLNAVGATNIVSYTVDSDGANWIVTGKVKNE